ncbi:hypothetical protein HNY73_022662 [Argiope bruennichi]|uniref:Uncharacterized protein n=1 Tax=Argiope bruennichi TaxID=94029 RepID=A0A8T0E578_ARGBR|nr:hypothetical protein HNY73_022662 [Argiope bruennichi]
MASNYSLPLRAVRKPFKVQNDPGDNGHCWTTAQFPDHFLPNCSGEVASFSSNVPSALNESKQRLQPMSERKRRIASKLVKSANTPFRGGFRIVNATRTGWNAAVS